MNNHHDEDQLVIKHDESIDSTSLLSTSFNLIMSILAAAILGIANVFHGFGIIGGLFCLLFSAICCYYSFTLLIDSSMLCQRIGYEELGSAALGRKGVYLVSFFLAMLNGGAILIYLIAVADNIASAVADWVSSDSVFRNRKFVMVLAGLVGGSLSYFRFLKPLRIFSYIAFGCSVGVGLLAMFVYFNYPSEVHHEDSVNMFSLSLDSVVVFPTLMFAFLTHSNMLSLYRELRDRTPKRMRLASLIFIGLTTVCYCLAGLFGYLTFRASTKSDLLAEYDPRYVIVRALQLLFSAAVILCIPLCFFPLRKALNRAFYEVDELKPLPHFVITTIILILLLLGAMFAPGIQTMYSLVGSAISPGIMFVLPALFFSVLHKKSHKPVPKTVFVCFWWGILVTIACTTITVGKQFEMF